MSRSDYFASSHLRIPASLASLILSLALFSTIASAQAPGVFAPAVPGVIEPPQATVPERQSVSQRPRPDYDALGLRAGSFLIFPSADVTEGFNSNIYVTQSGAKSDFITDLRPALTIESDWNNNALNFHSDGDIERYAQHVSENQSNFDVASNGRLDIQRDVYLTAGAGYQLAHEARTSPNSTTNEKSPTQYQLATADVGFVHDSGVLGLQLNGDVNSYSYNQNITNTGTPIPETYRDRMEYIVTPRVSYEYIPGYSAFVKAPLNWRQYNAARDSSGFQQNSNGYEVDAGTTVGLGQIVNGEIFAGYFQQNYADPRFKSPSGVNFGGNILWNVTPIDSIKGQIARTVQETIVQPASSQVETDVGLTAEHELLRNVILTANIDYSNQAYQGISRTDNVYSGGIGGRYLLNRNWSAGLTGTYSQRNSNVSGQGYSQEIFLADLHLQY
jgi:hypothetical protein